MLKKFAEFLEDKRRKCPSCSKPRLVWPDCYTCVNPGCERFIAGLVDPESTGMDKESLAYLAERLESIASDELNAAAALVRKVMASSSAALENPEAEHALFHAVWNHISQAADHAEYAPQFAQQVDALEAEMAGRVLTFRMQHSWIARTASGPTEFRRIEEFL